MGVRRGVREQVFWRKKHSGVLKQLGGCSRGEGALGREPQEKGLRGAGRLVPLSAARLI